MARFREKFIDFLTAVNPLTRRKRITFGHHRGHSDFHNLRFDKLPHFSLFFAETMRFDPTVSFGLAVRNGPLMTLEAEVTGPNETVNKFVLDQWNKIWRSSAHKLLRTKRYGFLGFEVMYKRDEQTNQIVFDRLIDLFPGETRPLMKNGEVVGFKWLPGAFQSFAGVDEFDESRHKVLRPKALWTTFDSEFGNPFGSSLLRRAFSPWYEKWMEKGGIDLRRLRYIKDAWVGMIVEYPTHDKLTLPDGTEVTGRDLAREVAENFLSGGTIALPSDRDESGNKKFAVSNPTDTSSGASNILDYISNLDTEIWRGVDLPKEVIEAAETGSGFSGRAIPFVAFLAILQVEGQELKEPIVRDILRPMVHLNHGNVPFELALKSLVDKMTEQMGAGAGPLGAQQPGQQPPRLSRAQFSIDGNCAPKDNGNPRIFAGQFQEPPDATDPVADALTDLATSETMKVISTAEKAITSALKKKRLI